MPVHSVGVQGDSRSYAPVLAIDALDHARATELINRSAGVNRVIAPRGDARAGWRDAGARLLAHAGTAWRGCASADAIVRRLSHESGYDQQVWQFPVILIPLGTAQRPIRSCCGRCDSVDGMTAQSVHDATRTCCERICAEMLHVDGIAGVFYDLTHKPPGTIEWE